MSNPVTLTSEEISGPFDTVEELFAHLDSLPTTPPSEDEHWDPVAAVVRVEALCQSWDAVSKGESPTTAAIRKAVRGDGGSA